MKRLVQMFALFVAAFSSFGCAGIDLSALPVPRTDVVEWKGVIVEAKSCELSPNRSFRCSLVLTSQFKDRKVKLSHVASDHKVQDDVGNTYRPSISFGLDPNGGHGSSLLVANQPYPMALLAKNVDTRATKVRSIEVGLYDEAGWGEMIALRMPTMVAPATVTATPTPAAIEVRAPSTPESSSYGPPSAPPTNPPAPAIPSKSPQGAAHPVEPAPTGWEVIGYWNYDGVDSMQLPHGLVLRENPGGNFGRTWRYQLDLVKHDSLPNRPRFLSPVEINRELRQVCANYPGYPTYAGHIDLPGSEHDGAYMFSMCAGGASESSDR